MRTSPGSAPFEMGPFLNVHEGDAYRAPGGGAVRRIEMPVQSEAWDVPCAAFPTAPPPESHRTKLVTFTRGDVDI